MRLFRPLVERFNGLMVQPLKLDRCVNILYLSSSQTLSDHWEHDNHFDQVYEHIKINSFIQKDVDIYIKHLLRNAYALDACRKIRLFNKCSYTFY